MAAMEPVDPFGALGAELADPFGCLGAACGARLGAGAGFETSGSSSQPESTSSSMAPFLEKSCVAPNARLNLCRAHCTCGR
jgi:hypothetical protein